MAAKVPACGLNGLIASLALCVRPPLLLARSDYSRAAEPDNTQAERNQVGGKGGVISISPPISPKICL